MGRNETDLKERLNLPEYPRSAKYDPKWMLENCMGPNAVWLTEALAQAMDLRPGMRVLDMGCGKAISSIFLAQEFHVNVWATDLWIRPSENWERIRRAGLENQVFPIYAEAHSLPFAHGFFDAIVSVDAYHYFGTADLYLGYFSKFVRPGGQIGIVVPGLVDEFDDGVPNHLKPYWEWDFCSFHSPTWWKAHWEKTGLVSIEVVAALAPRSTQRCCRASMRPSTHRTSLPSAAGQGPARRPSCSGGRGTSGTPTLRRDASNRR